MSGVDVEPLDSVEQSTLLRCCEGRLRWRYPGPCTCSRQRLTLLRNDQRFSQLLVTLADVIGGERASEPCADPLDHVRLSVKLGKNLHQARRVGCTLLCICALKTSVKVISSADLADAIVEPKMICTETPRLLDRTALVVLQPELAPIEVGLSRKLVT